MVTTSTGCDELSARRKIQEGNKLYGEGRYSQAAELFEQAIKKAPTLSTAHYNAGLTYLKMFRPGLKKPENIKIAEMATLHLTKYLESNPKDGTIVGLLTRIWMDSGQYKKALVYWEGELAKEPNNVEVLQILASINRQAGHWETSVAWHLKQADAETTRDGKAEAYLSIAKLVWHKLARRDKLIGLERLRVADVGLAALQKAVKAFPDHAAVHNYLATIYHFRAVAHGAAWARAVDEASAKIHRTRAQELRKAQKAKLPKVPKKAVDGKQGAAGGASAGGPTAKKSGG